MKRFLLYALIAWPAVPMWFAVGALAIPLGIAAGFALLLAIEVGHTAIVKDATLSYAAKTFCGIVFLPWRYPQCKNCGKYHVDCWGGR